MADKTLQVHKAQHNIHKDLRNKDYNQLEDNKDHRDHKDHKDHKDHRDHKQEQDTKHIWQHMDCNRCQRC